MCVLKIKNEDIRRRNILLLDQRVGIGHCSKDRSHARGKGNEIKTYRALMRTCSIFRNIIDATDLLFKDNTFEFCSFEELIILKSLTPNRRNKIKSIYLTDRIEGFLIGDPDVLQHKRGRDDHAPKRLQDVEAGYYTLGSCHGLRNLHFNMKWSMYLFRIYNGPNKSFPITEMAGGENHDALHSICGLENFHLATQSHQRHLRSVDFPCCFGGKCLNEFEYFQFKWFIYKGGLIEEHKRKWHLKMNLLEQQGKTSF
ncbi:hypothetical protein ACHAQE_005318 [Botrytis cinerea]